MKYKAGDKVKIKTWKAMEAEFGYKSLDDRVLAVSKAFIIGMEKGLDLNRILTIETVEENYYSMENINWSWTDDMIEGLAKEIKMIEPIESRFEILDI